MFFIKSLKAQKSLRVADNSGRRDIQHTCGTRADYLPPRGTSFVITAKKYETAILRCWRCGTGRNAKRSALENQNIHHSESDK